ncbi:MAG: hypothetical protein ACK5LC_04815, partial [Coprobacillaceae bacterium]
MSKRIKQLLTSLLVAIMVLSNVTILKADEPEETKTIQLLATSDVHNHFYPYQYMIDSEYNAGSLAKAASIIKEKRAENPNTILV